MYEKLSDRTLQTISITTSDFQQRLDQFKPINSPPYHSLIGVSFYSRLALILQVAKAYAQEAITNFVDYATELTIDEITNPPLYNTENGDHLVVIQFSYCNQSSDYKHRPA